MNCNEFIEGLNGLDSLQPGPDLIGHSKECRRCAQQLMVEMKLLGGLQVLKRLPSSPDFSKKVIKRIESEPGQGRGDLSLSEKLSRLIFPGSVFSSPAFVGVIGILFLVFFLKIGHRGTETPERNQPLTPGWEMSLVSGKLISGPVGLVAGGPDVHLERQKRIALTPGGIVNLRLPGIAEVQLSGADFESGSEGFKLYSGNARVKVFPRPPGQKFVVETPLGNVSVVGTEFSLELSEKGLKVKVFEGKVKVETAQRTTLVGPQQEETIQAKGSSKHSIPEVSSSVPTVEPASGPPSNE